MRPVRRLRLLRWDLPESQSGRASQNFSNGSPASDRYVPRVAENAWICRLRGTSPFGTENYDYVPGHVIGHAARAGPAEEGERPVMGVDDHLLRLARIAT